MSEVRPPNQPSNGVVRWKSTARCQSTDPARTGARVDTKASAAEALATGTATRVTQAMPHRFRPANATTRPQASAGTGTPGRHHWLMAVAERKGGDATGRDPAPLVADAGE